jgi:hypothetical protein
MNKKHHESNRGSFIVAVQVLLVLVVFMTVICIFDEFQANRRDPKYLQLESLSEAVITANNNLVLSLDESSEYSAGVSPTEMQRRADQAFEELLSRSPQNVPEKYVPVRARQILKDGPRRLIKVERETADSGGNAGIR